LGDSERTDPRSRAIPAETSAPDDRGVEAFVDAVNTVQRLSLFPWCLGRWKRQGRPAGLFAYVFVGSWIGIEAISLLAVGLTSSIAVAIAAATICVYRYADLIAWYLHFLFDWKHDVRVGAERNLLLLFANFAELTLIGAVILAGAGDLSAGDAWLRAFSTLTFSTFPRGGFWTDASIVALACAALLLVAGGLSVILSNVARKFR
jgi:hypothetical protein